MHTGLQGKCINRNEQHTHTHIYYLPFTDYFAAVLKYKQIMNRTVSYHKQIALVSTV